MTKMNVLLVDDEDAEVQVIIKTFDKHPVVELEHRTYYSQLGNTEAEFLLAVDQYDLLILDIRMGSDEKPFIQFVGAISGLKPFIAYTQLSQDAPLQLPTGYVDFRQWIARMGGMAMVSKTYSQNGADIDVEYEIIERIMSFYWCIR